MNRKEILKDIKISLEEAKEYKHKFNKYERKSKSNSLLSIICILSVIVLTIICVNLDSTTTVTDYIKAHVYDEDGNLVSSTFMTYYDAFEDGYYVVTREVPNPEILRVENIIAIIELIICLFGMLIFVPLSLGYDEERSIAEYAYQSLLIKYKKGPKVIKCHFNKEGKK